MKYKVLVDYYSEGFKFEDKEFDSVNEAVHYGVSMVTSSPWLVVSIIPWRAEGEWQ